MQKRNVLEKWRQVQKPDTERQRLFVLTIVIGGLCGLAAVAFTC